MPQVWLDEDAKRVIDAEKERLKENGRPGASLSDAIRSLAHERDTGGRGGA